MSGKADFRFEFESKAIGYVLSNRKLAVPIYQRAYSWKKEQVSDYWDDLHGAFRQGSQEYFIGNLVLSEEGFDGPYEAIIDGQQRLATTLLLLTAVRDEHMARGKQRAADEIHESFISRFDSRQEDDVPKLLLNSDDREFFRRLVVERGSKEQPRLTKPSHESIFQARQYLRKKVNELASSAGDEWYDRLVGLREFVEKRLIVVVVDVPTEADAFLIFETLNDRGADLTIADMLKNYLFRRAEGDMEVVRDAWVSALGALDMSAENAIFTKFIRHLWSSKHGATRERLLFREIKERITARKNAVDFGSEIQQSSQHYAAILNSEHDYWRGLGAQTKANIETIERLKLERVRPLLLALMQYFQDSMLKDALRSIVAWGVRGLIAGSIEGGRAEKAYCDAAVAVRKGKIKTVAELLSQLQSIIPTDEEFKAAFKTSRVSTSSGRAAIARYYLHALERVERKQDQPELVSNEDAEEVNLEHILPKNPKVGEWDQFSPEEQKAWLHRLGNMVLLRKGENDRIGNKPWTIKKPVLEASELRLTARAGKNDEWGRSEIESAQRHMAELALHAWPMSHSK